MSKTVFRRMLAVVVILAMCFGGLYLPSMVEAAPEPELSEITFSDYTSYDPSTNAPEGAVPDGLYAGEDYIIGTVSAKHATLDNVAFNGIVKFTDDVAANPQNTSIRIGGPSQWNQWPGIGIYYDNGIVLANYSGISDGTLCHVPETDPVTFKNKETVVRLTFQVENNTDLRIKFWVNETECYDGVIAGLAGKLGHGLLVYGESAGIEIKSYIPTPESEPEWTPSENLTEITPADFEMTAKEITSYEYGVYTGETLDGTRFTTKITLPSRQNGTYLRFGGKTEGGWDGLGLKVWKDTTTELEVTDNSGHTSYLEYISAKENETVLGKEVELDITTEFIDADNDGNRNDVLHGIFFDDVLYKTVMLKDHKDYVGKQLMFYTDNADYPILLEYEIPVQEPEWIPSENLTEITPADFGMTAKNITSYAHGVYTGNTLDGTRFTTKITLPERQNGSYLRIGGVAEGGWGGFGLNAWKSGTSEFEITDNSGHTEYKDYIAAKESEALLGTEVKLDITTEFIDADSDGNKNDVLYGIFFNDDLYKTVMLKDHKDYVGKQLMFYTDSADYPILLEYEIPVPGPGSEPEWTPSKNLTVITPADFGMTAKKVTLFEYGTYKGVTLNGTRFTTKITMPERQNGTYLCLGGVDSEGWTGLGLKVWLDGATQFQVIDNSGHTSYVDYVAAKADEVLLGKEVKLDITTEFIDADKDGKKDDVLYGIFFNDELYKTVMFENHTQNVGTKLLFYTDSEEFPILLNYKKAEIKKPKLTDITMQSMGIMEGKYTYCNDLVVQGSYKDSLVGTSMTQKITLSKHAGTWFLYAGGPSAWHGIRFVTQEDGSIMFQAADGEFSNIGILTPEIAGTDLVGKEIELGIELFEDGDNVMMGVYINGILYKDQYFTLIGAKGKLGKYASFYVKDKKGYVVIGKPVAAPTIDKSFDKITFNSFDVEKGTYKYDPLGFSTSGNCGLTSLDKVVFSDTVNFSDAAGAQMRFGGKNSAWEGMVWETIGGGKLQLTAATGEFPAMVFTSEIAGVRLTGNDVDIKFSFEYIDADGDGKKDDVKFGVWFNGKAYNNRWIYLMDYAEKLGGYFGVYCPNKKTSLKLYTYMPPIDFTEYGFTTKWALELGLKKK